MLLMPIVGFISPYSDFWETTLKAIETELVSDVLGYWYKGATNTFDRLKGDEGTFMICSFWYVQCLSKGGEMEKAARYYEKLLEYANHVGLYAEQV